MAACRVVVARGRRHTWPSLHLPPLSPPSRLASHLLACIQGVPAVMRKLSRVSASTSVTYKAQHSSSAGTLGCVNALVAVAGWVEQDCARYNASAERQLQEDEEVLSSDHDAR